MRNPDRQNMQGHVFNKFSQHVNCIKTSIQSREMQAVILWAEVCTAHEVSDSHVGKIVD